jgi:UDP-N-acetylmuramate--alanine ligase
MKNNFAVIILAAGKGTRMQSSLPKVLHKIGGRSMLARTVDIVEKTKPDQILVVVGHGARQVKKTIGPRVTYAMQTKQLGTADAAMEGLKKVKKSIQTVVILNGDDSAFYKPSTILDVIKTHKHSHNRLTFVTLDVEDPQGLGRVVRRGAEVLKVVEEKDATENERKIREVNDGLYVFEKNWLRTNLKRTKPSPVTQEYYLVDLIKMAISNKDKICAYKLKDSSQWHGINTPSDLEKANTKAAKIHFMGISGAGAAAVAGIASKLGFKISGCDLFPDSPYVQNLQIKISKGHSKNHLKNQDMLVVSPAVLKLDSENEEIKQAEKLKIPVLTWQEFQGKYLHKDKYVITVAGAYGKSTTTAMIAKILTDAGLDPTCEIGAKVLDWNSNFHVGRSKYYVCESDEYNNNFLNYRPDIAVVLNVSWDHPDFFKTKESLLDSYKRFIKNIKEGGTLIIRDAQDLIELSKSASRGTRVVKIKEIADLKLSIIGEFRKQNASAALAVANLLNINPKQAITSVSSFSGVGRRLEYKGTIAGTEFFDDYAVQPFTIAATADSLKEKFKDKKVLIVLEPHTFSRVETFFGDFVESLKKTKADAIFITDVYAARETGNRKSLAKKLAQAGAKTRYSGSLEQTAKLVAGALSDFQVVCSMGAGDSYKLYNMVLAEK